MADITEELQAIATAQKGKDVRSAIHDGIKKVNETAAALQPATPSLLGGVKIGPGLSVTPEGLVSASNGGEYVTVKNVGCIGDGVTDDTANFQLAINTAITAGKPLYINPGTYLITERITIAESLSVLGGNHDTTIIKFRGTYHTETAYDTTWYEESNACLRITGSNVSLENFIIQGGDDKYNTSECNGIIFHYTKPDGLHYDAAQRCEIVNVDIKCFRHGVFIYAGWNRYFLLCHFVDNLIAGIKWYPLELASVGAWADSGDIIMGCQFVGNGIADLAQGKAGLWATNAFQTTVWQCVFEYNKMAVDLIDCHDIVIKNGWNEANYNSSHVKGNARFEGGYNFSPTTVNHELTGGSDIVKFDAETSTIIKSGSVTKFIQQGGIITKGVEIGAEVDNMIANPYFVEASGGTGSIPSTTGWSFYPGSSICTVDETMRYNGHNSLHYVVADRTSDSYFQANPDTIVVEAGKTYNIEFQCRTADRFSIDGKLMLFIAWKNAAGETIVTDNTELTMIGNDNWELKTHATTAPYSAANLVVGLGCTKDGNVYFAEPLVSVADSLVKNNVFVRQSATSGKLDVFDISGVMLGKVTLEL